MKKKNGYTLIELLIVVAVIGSLTVIIGINSNNLTNNANKNKYRQTYRDLFKAAAVYSELTSSYTICKNGCDVTINNLIEKGLVDENILSENNPLFKNTIFKEGDIITVSFKDGKKQLEYKSITNSNCKITEEKLEEKEFDSWGECNETTNN